MLGAAKREGRDLPDMDEQTESEARSLKLMVERMRKGWKNRYLQEDKLTLIAPDMAANLADRSSPHRAPLIEFFRALAICHGVVADKDPDNPYLVDYKAESPDGTFSLILQKLFSADVTSRRSSQRPPWSQRLEMPASPSSTRTTTISISRSSVKLNAGRLFACSSSTVPERG